MMRRGEDSDAIGKTIRAIEKSRLSQKQLYHLVVFRNVGYVFDRYDCGLQPRL